LIQSNARLIHLVAFLDGMGLFFETIELHHADFMGALDSFELGTGATSRCLGEWCILQLNGRLVNASLWSSL
jgi:hypothetical protein